MKPSDKRSVALRIGFSGMVLAFCAAPVPGDIGGCSRPAEPLNAEAFFEDKRAVDCSRCRECGLESHACEEACSARTLASLSDGCVPLEHDGQVCLRALLAASCDQVRGYMRDAGATAPTECDFCPRNRQ